MKLTDEQRQKAIQELGNKLEKAIDETPRGITEQEISEVFQNISSLIAHWQGEPNSAGRRTWIKLYFKLKRI